MKKILFNLILGFAGLISLAHAGAGTTGAQFLKIDASARPMGMGGAYAAVAEDSNAVFYNPAGLARQEDKELAGTYMSYFESITYGSLSSVMPGENSVLGIGVNYVGVGDLDKRSATDTNDATGTGVVDTFSAMDTAVSLIYAKQDAVPSIMEGLDLGTAIRVIYQTIDEESAFSAMIDLGAYYPVNDKLALALNIQNIGMAVKFVNESDPLPLNIKAGAAYKLMPSLMFACDINEYIVDQMLYASLGGEYWIKNVVALRAGYKYGYDTDSLGSSVGVSGGLGFRYSSMGLDYAFAPFGELGDTHRITFSIKM